MRSGMLRDSLAANSLFVATVSKETPSTAAFAARNSPAISWKARPWTVRALLLATPGRNCL